MLQPCVVNLVAVLLYHDCIGLVRTTLSKSDNAIKLVTCKLQTICNKFVDIIRLVARLFQQVQYNHDKTILLQPYVVNPVTFLYTR
jgi:hypothetical protein